MNFFKENNILANMPTSVLNQPKKFRKNIKSPRNYSSKTLKSSRLILKQLEPIYEDEVSCASNEKSDSFGNVVLEEIFFKENPFRVCGHMKVSDIKMALDVKMTMQFTNDFWETFDESPIICNPTFYDTIEFEVEIPQKMLQKGNIDFRVCSKMSNSANSIQDALQ